MSLSSSSRIGEHDLGHLAVDHVAIGIDPGQSVVLPEFLRRVRPGQDVRIPQPDVAEGDLVRFDLLGLDDRVSRERTDLHPVESVGGAGEREVVGYVGGLADERIGHDPKLLDHGRIDHPGSRPPPGPRQPPR